MCVQAIHKFEVLKNNLGLGWFFLQPIALGGDETGIMKAKEVTKVEGSMSSNGLVSVLRANSAKMGMRIEADATLEAT